MFALGSLLCSLSLVGHSRPVVTCRTVNTINCNRTVISFRPFDPEIPERDVMIMMCVVVPLRNGDDTKAKFVQIHTRCTDTKDDARHNKDTFSQHQSAVFVLCTHIYISQMCGHHRVYRARTNPQIRLSLYIGRYRRMMHNTDVTQKEAARNQFTFSDRDGPQSVVDGVL